ILDDVADIDRLQPFEIAKAERGADAGNRLAARPHALGQPPAVIDVEPHPHDRRVPAGSAQRAEVRALRRDFVDMEILRVETAGESLDRFRGEGVAAELEDVADLDVLEKLHDAAAPSRRPMIIELVSVVRIASCSSRTS